MKKLRTYVLLGLAAAGFAFGVAAVNSAHAQPGTAVLTLFECDHIGHSANDILANLQAVMAVIAFEAYTERDIPLVRKQLIEIEENRAKSDSGKNCDSTAMREMGKILTRAIGFLNAESHEQKTSNDEYFVVTGEVKAPDCESSGEPCPMRYIDAATDEHGQPIPAPDWFPSVSKYSEAEQMCWLNHSTERQFLELQPDGGYARFFSRAMMFSCRRVPTNGD